MQVLRKKLLLYQITKQHYLARKVEEKCGKKSVAFGGWKEF